MDDCNHLNSNNISDISPDFLASRKVSNQTVPNTCSRGTLILKWGGHFCSATLGYPTEKIREVVTIGQEEKKKTLRHMSSAFQRIGV